MLEIGEIQASEKSLALLSVKIAEVEKLLRRASLSAANRERLTEKHRQFQASYDQEKLRLSQLQEGASPGPLPTPPPPSERPEEELPPEPDDSLQGQLDRSHRHREALLEWLVDLREKVAVQTQAASQSQQALEKSQQEQVELGRRQAELEQRLAQTQKEHQHLEQLLSQEGRERQQLEGQLEAQRASNLELEERARQESIERAQLLHARNALEMQLQNANLRLVEFERLLALEENERHELQARISELEGDKTELRALATLAEIEKNKLNELAQSDQRLHDSEHERSLLSGQLAEREQALINALAEVDILRSQLNESESNNADLTTKLAGKSKKRGDSKAAQNELEQKLQTAERERAEFERLAVLAERDRAGLAARVGRLEQELVDHHAELDRESGLREQLSSEVAQLQALTARLEEERTSASARNEQLEELLILTEKELFQRQRQYNEECAKVESMADHFLQIRLDRESLETRLQLLAREKAEGQRRLREQARLIKLLKHDLEFFKPDRLIDSAESALGDLLDPSSESNPLSSHKKPSEWSL